MTDVSTGLPRRTWIGLAAVAVYVVLIAGGGFLIDAVLGTDPPPVIELAFTHLIPLPIAIAAGVVFARRSGWWHDIWTDIPLHRTRPRRSWMLIVPVAISAQILLLFIQTPWASLTAPYITVGLLCYLLVGLGEELYFRGILLESVRGHHGETVTMLVTALAFGLAHSLGSALGGVPVGVIAFQVSVTALDGILFYAVLRVTGTLWAPILLHGLGDWGRWLAAGDGEDHATSADGAVQTVIMILALAVVVSVIREDRRNRRADQAGPSIPVSALPEEDRRG